MDKNKITKHILILWTLLGVILFMTIGYASINSITGDIKGTVIANVQDGVFITNVEYISDIDANLNMSEIVSYQGTLLENRVKLSETNANSEIKYKITIYNKSLESCYFMDAIYDKTGEFYDNPNIIFEINEFNIGNSIEPNETKEIMLTFKYKNGIIPQNTTLKSIINFKIIEPRRLKICIYGPQTENYLGSAVAKEKIEKIEFRLGKEETNGTISKFDASEKQNESIMGYYTDIDSNGLYELTFASNEIIAPNKDAAFLFNNLTELKEIQFNNFCTLNVTKMSWMFKDCHNLQTLDICEFNTNEVIYMDAMFQNCYQLESICLSKFDTSKVKTMNAMFSGCSRLISLDITKFNTSQVTDMENMFRNCKKLTRLNIENFDTKKVKSMAEMFYGCIGLEELNLSKFDTSQVTSMMYMFYSCKNLKTLDITKFNTSNVTNMLGMFAECINLTNLDVGTFDTSQVLNMEEMFQRCSKLITLDISKFNTSKVTNMSRMFYGCVSLKTIYATEFNEETNIGWTTSAVSNSGNMFYGCNRILGGNGTVYNSNYTNATYAQIDTVKTPGYFTNILEKVM